MKSNESGRTSTTTLICGLGRFGSATALALQAMEYDLLAIDQDPKIVAAHAALLERVVEADCTNVDVLTDLGVSEFSKAVVGIGGSVEASVLTCLALVDLGVPNIWAKAISVEHARILDRIGVQHVVRPEFEAGKRTANLVNGKLMDFIEFEDGYAIVKMRAPKETHGFRLEESQIRNRYGITVVGIKSPGQDFVHAVPSTRVTSHDTLIVSGKTIQIMKFAARP